MSTIAYALEKCGLISEEKANCQADILPLVKERRMVIKNMKSQEVKADHKHKLRVSILTSKIKELNKELLRL